MVMILFFRKASLFHGEFSLAFIPRIVGKNAHDIWLDFTGRANFRNYFTYRTKTISHSDFIPLQSLKINGVKRYHHYFEVFLSSRMNPF